MKTKIISFMVMVLLMLSLGAQHTSHCKHKSSFQQSSFSDSIDAIKYVITIDELDFSAQTINANTQVNLESKVENLNFVKLELIDLEVDSVRVNAQNSNFQYDDSVVTIPLSTTLNTGDQVWVRVFYHGQPFHEAWGGFHWSGEYCFNLGVGFESIPHNLGKTWFPCIDNFQDKALFQYNITVEEGKDAVCGGLLAEVVNNGNGTNTFTWWHEHPIPTYLASVAVGDYAWWSSTYNGVNEDIPVWIFTKPNDSVNVDGSFVNLDTILCIFEDKFGPYRFERVGYVGTAIGAMEHATNIAYPHSAINGGLQNESLLAHELAHMWFGDNVTCASAEEMWINEGWATFMDGIYQEFLYSRGQYLSFLRAKHKDVIQFCHTPSGGGYFFPLNQIPQTDTYNDLAAYDRGAIMAHTLRGYLGDEVFFDAMTEFNEEYKYNYASSEDMRDFLTSHTGIDMTGWFDNWVFHSGTPHFSVDSMSVNPTPGNTDVIVYLRQRRHGPEFTGNDNKFELTFMDEDWNQLTENIEFDGHLGTITFSLPIVPEAVFVDLNELMFDATTDYRRKVSGTGEIHFPNSHFKLDVQNISDSVFFSVEHNWTPPDSLKNPVQGLTISPYRYWKIDGVFDYEFVAKGIFWYNKGAFLDDGLIESQNDSVVMLYRPGTNYDWQFVDFTVVGIWSIGNLHVENLQKGEYALAVCDDTFVGIKKNEQKTNTGLNIYPNPSNGIFNIDTNQSGTLTIYNIEGQIIDNFILANGQNHISWSPDKLKEGTYFVKFISAQNKVVSTEKLIYIKN